MYDIKSVDSCPTSKDGWDQAAKNKKCTDIAKRKNCTHTVIKLLYVYHCVINAYLNETLEVCAPRRVIFGNVEVQFLFWLSNCENGFFFYFDVRI